MEFGNNTLKFVHGGANVCKWCESCGSTHKKMWKCVNHGKRQPIVVGTITICQQCHDVAIIGPQLHEQVEMHKDQFEYMMDLLLGR